MENKAELMSAQFNKLDKYCKDPAKIIEAISEQPDTFIRIIAIADDELGRRIRKYFMKIIGDEDGE